MARARNITGYVATLAVGLTGGFLIGSRDNGHETSAEKPPCASAWADFSVPGDPTADSTKPDTWTKAVVVEFTPDEKGMEQQAGFTDPQGIFHESDLLVSENGTIAFKIGHEDVRVSVREFDKAGGLPCGYKLGELAMVSTDVTSQVYDQASKPVGWRDAAR